MKKMLLLCTGLFLAAGIASAQVTSANIVGYLKTPSVASAYLTGATFAQVGTCTNTTGEATWSLSNLKQEGMNYRFDSIQFLNPVTAEVNLSISWRDPYGWVIFQSTTPVNDLVFDISEGFLCSFSSDVTLTYSGEVIPGTKQLIFAAGSPVVANYLPVDVYLDELEMTGNNYRFDSIQFLNPDTAMVDLSATWRAGYGWVEFQTTDYVGDRLLKAGTAFLCSFSSNGVTLTFPDPLTLVRP